MGIKEGYDYLFPFWALAGTSCGFEPGLNVEPIGVGGQWPEGSGKGPLHLVCS